MDICIEKNTQVLLFTYTEMNLKCVMVLYIQTKTIQFLE